VEVAWGKPREIRFRITNINANNRSPISMELLGNGSGVMVVVASTSSRDRTPPVSWYPQCLVNAASSNGHLKSWYGACPVRRLYVQVEIDRTRCNSQTLNFECPNYSISGMLSAIS
jgi:hypothetical protein